MLWYCFSDGHVCLQGDGEDEEPVERQQLVVGAWEVHEPALPHSGIHGHYLYHLCLYKKVLI